MDKNNTVNQIFFHGQQASVDLLLSDRAVRLEPAMIHAVVNKVLWILVSPSLVPGDIDPEPGMPLEVRVGSFGQGFRCRATIASYSTSGIMELNLNGTLASDELRDYYRLDTYIPMSFQAHVAEGPPPPPRVDLAFDPVKRVEARIWWDKEKEQSFQWDVNDSRSAIINISGGGIKAKIDEPVSPGDILHVGFQVPAPELRKVSALAKVAYLQSSATDGTRYAGMKFITLHERDRDSIIKYVFNQETRKVKTPPSPAH
jgi:hypothetical protein